MAQDLPLSEDIICLQVLEAHSSDVTSCDFGNNAMLASGSGDRTARLWHWSAADDCFVEAPCSPLEGHKYGVTCVSFSPQGTMLATGSVDGTTILWNVASGARIHVFVPATGSAVRAVRFAPDSGSVLTADDSGSLCIWDLLRRSLARCIWAHEGAVYALGATPDGRLLVSGCSNGALRVWAAVGETGGDGQSPSSPRRAPAAALSGASGTLEVPLAQVEDAHDLGILAGDVSPWQTLEDADQEEDGSSVEAEWERGSDCVGKGRRLRHRYLAATGGNDNAVRLWDVRSPACMGGCAGETRATLVPAEPHHALLGHGSAVTAVRFARDGALVLSAGLDKTARVWHVASGSCVSVVSGHDRFVFAVAASRCGTLLATGSYDQRLRTWALAGDRRPPPPAPAAAAASRRAAAALNGQERALLKHAEVEGGAAPSLLQRLAPEECGAVNGVAFALGGRLLASAHGDKLVRVWARDLDSGRFTEAPCSPLEGHRYSVLATEFAPGASSRLASCSLDGEALLWDAQAGERAGSPLLCAGGGALRALRFSHDGHLLATAGDDERVCVWALASGELLLSAEGHSDAVSGLAVSPDSQLLASCSADESIRLWALSPPSENCLLALDAAHDLGAASVDFSPSEGMPGYQRRHGGLEADDDSDAQSDHRYLLASGGNDGHLRMWRVYAHLEDGTLAVDCVRAWRVLVGHAGSITCVRFCPGAGDLLASAAIDRSARVWNVYTGDCLHVLEGHASLLTAVAFSSDCSLLATGSLDKSVLVWELPAHLVFQAAGSDSFRANTKPGAARGGRSLTQVVEWAPEDVARWLTEWGLPRVATRALASRLRGHALLTAPLVELLTRLDLDGAEDARLEDVHLEVEAASEATAAETRARVRQLLRWLRRAEAAGWAGTKVAGEEDPPDQFLCPITHEVMRDPVLCADGFTYERAALSEWLLGGRFSSPMTNAPLASTRLRPNAPLRRLILVWMFGEDADDDEEDEDWPLLAPAAEVSAGNATEQGDS